MFLWQLMKMLTSLSLLRYGDQGAPRGRGAPG